MATRKPNEKPDLTPDAAAPPPGEPPDTIPIYGILGESPVASNVRLYLDLGMSTYYDIPIEGIAGREKVPADQSPLGVDSTLLFVRKGIRLVVHHSDSRTVEDEFLAGDFTSPGSFTPAAGGVAGGAEQGIAIRPSALCATNIACNPTVQICGVQTIQTVCTQIGCQTRLLGCQTATAATQCFTFHPVCNVPTRVETVCRPSLGIACTIDGCHPTGCVANTIRPTTFTQFIQCQTGCMAHTIRPTIWTQIDCPIHTGINCESAIGPCQSWICGPGGIGGGDPEPGF